MFNVVEPPQSKLVHVITYSAACPVTETTPKAFLSWNNENNCFDFECNNKLVLETPSIKATSPTSPNRTCNHINNYARFYNLFMLMVHHRTPLGFES